jgi:hypothetical protein
MAEFALIVLPIAMAVGIAAATVIVLRRSGVIAAETREAAAGRRLIADLAGQADTVLLPISERIDQLRRGQLPATDLEEDLEQASRALGALREASESLAVPRDLVAERDAILGELARSERALDMVEHGRGILASARGRGRELEAQTAIKRGYLNLLHAREAIVNQATAAAMWRSPTEARRDARRIV